MNFYSEVFHKATGYQPFPYQEKMADEHDISSVLRVPTGAGKTAAVVMGWLWRRRFAGEEVKSQTPRRLVYCLPMRVLVEQTVSNIENWLNRLNLANSVRVHVLMGGEEKSDWDIALEQDAVIVGTQDMLLSRALNRGFGMSRYRWPMHFGALNNDCMWVLDEIQLMGSGLPTTAQLDAFRRDHGTLVPCYTLWMSATMETTWLHTVDHSPHDIKTIELDKNDREAPQLKKRLNASKYLTVASATAEKPKPLAKEVLAKHTAAGDIGSMTLVVVNTVEKAVSIYTELLKLLKTRKSDQEPPELILLHSRFRPPDRKNIMQNLVKASRPKAGTIVVSTQVIEAGVDISAKTLFTELSPWPSLIQRFGRCNRYGEYNTSMIILIELDKKKNHAPYETSELTLARDHIQNLKKIGAGPNHIAGYIASLIDDKRRDLMPVFGKHVIRRKDLMDLFDTTPDLAGNDIDVSRFIRDGDHLDVQVFWRDIDPNSGPGNEEPQPAKNELCSVPVGQIRKALEEDKKTAWRWDGLERTWAKVDANRTTPGQVYLLPCSQGGYTPSRGWDGKNKERVEPVSIAPGTQDIADSNDDDPYVMGGSFQTISQHADLVCQEVETILNALSLELPEEHRNALIQAARWHDLGKAHAVFQNAIVEYLQTIIQTAAKEEKGSSNIEKEEVTSEEFLAKAPRGQNPRLQYRRRGFRHELASALAMLQAGMSDLAVYLVAAHHGKIRLSIRSLPTESRDKRGSLANIEVVSIGKLVTGAADILGVDRPKNVDTIAASTWLENVSGRTTPRFARGIWEGDVLPKTRIGGGQMSPEVRLRLDVMELGLNESGQPSWTSRMLRLRDALGPFRLAYLESILRAADMRASKGVNSD